MRDRPRTSCLAASSTLIPVSLTLVLLVMAGCGKDKVLKPPPQQTPAPQIISTPSAPVGPTAALQGDSIAYSTGGAVSSSSDTLEYRFDSDAAGAHAYTSWSRDSSTTIVWAATGVFVIKAQARSATHPSVVSTWSGGLTVTISPSETVTTPNQPTGGSGAIRGDGVPYTTGGSVSSKGHPVEYRFRIHEASRVVPDDSSGWSPTARIDRTWNVAGTYYVTAQARCAADTLITSEWSSALMVTVSPTGTPVIVSGTLVVVSTGSSSAPLVLRQALGSWDEQTVTWGTMPSLSDSLASASYTSQCFIICYSAAQFSVGAALLQSWLDHTVANEGLAVGPGTATSSDLTFFDRTNYLFAPYLRVFWRYSDETAQRTKIIPMSQDTYADENHPSSNYGLDANLIAGRSGGGDQVILVKANLILP